MGECFSLRDRFLFGKSIGLYSLKFCIVFQFSFCISESHHRFWMYYTNYVLNMMRTTMTVARMTWNVSRQRALHGNACWGKNFLKKRIALPPKIKQIKPTKASEWLWMIVVWTNNNTLNETDLLFLNLNSGSESGALLCIYAPALI